MMDGKLTIREISPCGVEKLFPQDALPEFLDRFHYDPADTGHILGLREAMLPLVAPEVCFHIKEREIFLGITLGDGADGLQELYLAHQQVGDAYIIECIRCYLLDRIYSLLPELIYREAGRWIGTLRFPEDADSLSFLRDVLLPAGSSIRVSPCGSLIPGPSVLCRAVLSEEKCRDMGGVCAHCSRKADCPMSKTVLH